MGLCQQQEGQAFGHTADYFALQRKKNAQCLLISGAR
jgi:hypothetical protein